MTQTRHGYTIIPGSAELRSSKDVVEQLQVLEAHDGRFHDVVRGEELYSCAKGGFPDDVFTRLLPMQKPLEQLVYLHLLQRAVAHGRNFCRVSRSQLAQSCQLSPRRLGTALAGLVDADHVRLVDRNRKGTLYRVCLPHEVVDDVEAPSAASLVPAPSPTPTPPTPTPTAVDEVAPARTMATGAPLVSFAKAAREAASSTSKTPAAHSTSTSTPNERTRSASMEALLGTPIQAAPSTPAAQKTEPTPEPAAQLTVSPPAAPTAAAPAGPQSSSTTLRDSPGRIASWFIEEWGGGPGRAKADIIEVIFDRLEAGQPFAVIREELNAFGAQERTAPIATLKTFLTS